VAEPQTLGWSRRVHTYFGFLAVAHRDMTNDVLHGAPETGGDIAPRAPGQFTPCSAKIGDHVPTLAGLRLATRDEAQLCRRQPGMTLPELHELQKLVGSLGPKEFVRWRNGKQAVRYPGQEGQDALKWAHCQDRLCSPMGSWV
jgi:hypothetical protein